MCKEVEPEIVKEAPMSYLDLLILIRTNLVRGRLDNAAVLLTEAINQLEAKKKQDENNPVVKNGFAGLCQDANSPDLKNCEPLQPGD